MPRCRDNFRRRKARAAWHRNDQWWRAFIGRIARQVQQPESFVYIARQGVRIDMDFTGGPIASPADLADQLRQRSAPCDVSSSS